MYMCLILINIYFERVTILNSETVPKKCGRNIIFRKQVYSHNLTQFNLDFVNDGKSVTILSSSWKGKCQQESFLVIRTNAKSITYFGCRKTQKRWLLRFIGILSSWKNLCFLRRRFAVSLNVLPQMVHKISLSVRFRELNLKSTTMPQRTKNRKAMVFFKLRFIYGLSRLWKCIFALNGCHFVSGLYLQTSLL